MGTSELETSEVLKSESLFMHLSLPKMGTTVLGGNAILF